VCLSKKKNPKFIPSKVELRVKERERENPKTNNPCCEGHHRQTVPHRLTPAVAAALTSLSHAKPAAGARQTGQWFCGSEFGSQIWFFFFFLSYFVLIYFTT
jgi:hypothetical protein